MDFAGHLNQCKWRRLLSRWADNRTECGGSTATGRLEEARAAKQDGGAETRRTNIIEIEYISAVTSSTPLEVVRVQCSLMMSTRGGKGELLVTQLLDASRAHPHCDVLRDHVCGEAPPELHLEKELWLLVKRSTYAMRDAGLAFEFAGWDHFQKKEFVQNKNIKCGYRHRVDQMRKGGREDHKATSLKEKKLRPDGHKVCDGGAHALHHVLLTAQFVG